MKTNKKENQKPKKTMASTEKESADVALDSDPISELREPRWSVVSFENRVASNLTYDEATEKLNKLKTEKVSGLCIITDEAAERILKSRESDKQKTETAS